MWMAAFPGGFNRNHIEIAGKLSELVTIWKTIFSCSCNLKVIVKLSCHYLYGLNTSMLTFTLVFAFSLSLVFAKV
jgi:hypothetical protein